MDVNLSNTIRQKDYIYSTELVFQLGKKWVSNITVGLFLDCIFCSLDLSFYFFISTTLS